MSASTKRRSNVLALFDMRQFIPISLICVTKLINTKSAKINFFVQEFENYKVIKKELCT